MLANQSLDLNRARAIRAALCPLSDHRRLTATGAGVDARAVNRGDPRRWGAGDAEKIMKLTETHSLSKPRNARRKPKTGGQLGKPLRSHHNLISRNFVFSHAKSLFNFKPRFMRFFRREESPTLDDRLRKILIDWSLGKNGHS